jgi:hypothetical protein
LVFHDFIAHVTCLLKSIGESLVYHKFTFWFFSSFS